MRHFINNIEIAPRDLESIGVVSDFTGRPDELNVNVDSVTLPREGRDIVMQHINTQGVFEGIPYQIQLNSGVILDYYIDLTEPTQIRQHEVVVKLKKRLGKDSFFDRADGTTFELMAKKGVVFNNFNVPYIIVKDNAIELGVSLGISLYIMTKELIQAIKDLAEATAQLIQAVTVNTGVPPSVDTGDIIALAIKVAAQLIYTAAVLIAVIKLGQQLLELIFPKIRYFLGVKCKELLSKGCGHLGYTFQSTLLDNISGLTLLPVPLKKQTKSFFDFLQNDLNLAFNKGYPTAQDTTPTLGSLLTAMEDMFNARTKVVNGVVRLERRDFWFNLSATAIVPALSLQDDRDDEYTLNVEEVWKRYYISYQTDYTDIHTADDFDSTDAEYSTEPVNVINSDLVTIKGLTEVQIPFAMGRRKDKLNWIEKLAKAMLETVDEVANAFGGDSSLAALIENRVGVLQVSNQYFGTTKLLYTVGGKQPANYKDLIRASRLWNDYHYINQIQLNDYLVKEGVRVRISDADFINLLNNNYASIDGVVVEILRLEYIDDKSFATISYKQPFNYANGKVTTLTING